MTYDAVVIGGGPAGSTAAALIAQAGHRVLLADRERFPRFRLGESLMPATYWSFERLGVLDKMKSSSFVQKHSVQFYTKTGKGALPFYFAEFDGHESSQTWQVDRNEFDAAERATFVELMLDGHTINQLRSTQRLVVAQDVCP